MSWLARSLANSLRLDHDDGGGDDHRHGGDIPVSDDSVQSPISPLQRHEKEDDDHFRSDAQGCGVKEDLSELRETLTRQLWGVASFLAPPPSQPSTPSSSHANNPSASDWNRREPSDPSVSGEFTGGEYSDEDASGAAGKSRSDIFRTGISKLSHHRTVSEISRIASNFLPFGPEEEEDMGSVDEYDFRGVVGVTEEVLTFATNIAMHPETWLDFPLEEEQDMDDFELSDAQREHALAVEHLLPRLEALRVELCPNHMSEGYFWKVYFVLLHSRLNKIDSGLLSTPQLVAARARWMHELRKRTEPEQDWSKRITSHSKEYSNLQHEGSFRSSPFSPIPENIAGRKSAFEPVIEETDIEMEKYLVSSTEMQFIDKSVIEERPVTQSKDKMIGAGQSSKVDLQAYEDDGDDWLQDEMSELGPYSGTAIPLGNEEVVSFSDLEDDDDISAPLKS